MVLLPEYVQRLLALTRQDGGPFLRMGCTEVQQPYIGPLTQVQLTAAPATGIWGLYLYHLDYGDTPWDAFSVDVLNAGALCETGRLTNEKVQFGTSLWALLRTQYPIQIVITNNDPIVAHPFRFLARYLIIDNRDDFEVLQEVTKKLMAGGVEANFTTIAYDTAQTALRLGKV